MLPLHADEMDALMNHEEAYCLSFLLAGRRAGVDVLQTRIQLKNFIHQAELELDGLGVKRQALTRWLFPLRGWLQEDDFWEHQEDGIVFYASPSRLRIFNLPVRVEESLVVSNRFYMKPLLKLMAESGRFAVLSLSQKQARLFVGDLASFAPAGLPDAPVDFEEIMATFDTQRQQHFHSETPPGVSGVRRPPIYYGRGLGTDPSQMKTHLFEYCRAVDQAVRRTLDNQAVPLVLAAVAPLQTIYRDANTYPRLLPEGLVSNHPDQMTMKDLHRGGIAIHQQAEAEARRRESARHWSLLAGGPRVLRDVDQVLAAAHRGQIDTLYVTEGEHVWGRYQADALRAELHGQRQLGDHDLLDLAASRTHLALGKVLVVARDQVPEGLTCAAILRYPFSSQALAA